jgi:PHD/YefM family antitoxin component YafN of YafNO toxin-antitoxin module
MEDPMNTMPIIEAREKLSTLPEAFAEDPEMGAAAITRRGQPVLAVMPWELYEALVETLDVLGDEDLMQALRQSLREAEGQLIPWETSGPDRHLCQGYVYLLQCGPYYKVGRTVDLSGRLRARSVELSHKPVLLHAMPTATPEALQRAWHCRLAARRLNGEWFALTPEDVAMFCQEGRS